MSKRKNKGHPKRVRRQERAAERLANGTPVDRTKAYRLQSVFVPELDRRVSRAVSA